MATTKFDPKREIPSYTAAHSRFDLVEVLPLRYAMVDGEGDPNTVPEYTAAVEALYAVSYAAKFQSRRELDRDYVVGPLEGLWSASDPSTFVTREKSAWSWTMMIWQPDWLTPEAQEAAVAKAIAKAPAAARLRFETLDEGLCVQTLHRGSYDDDLQGDVHAGEREPCRDERAERGADREGGVELRQHRLAETLLDGGRVDVDRHVHECAAHAVDRHSGDEEPESEAEQPRGIQAEADDVAHDARDEHVAAAETCDDRADRERADERAESADDEQRAELQRGEIECIADRRHAAHPRDLDEAEQGELGHERPSSGGDGRHPSNVAVRNPYETADAARPGDRIDGSPTHLAVGAVPARA